MTKHEPIPWGPSRLGRFGLPINVVYGTFTCIFLVFPPFQPVTASNMNYASLVFGVVLIFSLVSWFVYGRTSFNGPIKDVADEEFNERLSHL